MFSRNRPEPARPWSIAARLTAWYAATAFLLIGLAVGAMDFALSRQLEREQDELLADKARVLTLILRERPGDLEELKQEMEREGEGGRVAIRILGVDGRTVLEMPGMTDQFPPGTFPPPGPPQVNDQPGTVIHATSGTQYRAVTVHVSESGGGADRILQLAFDRTKDAELLAGYRRSLWPVLVAALAACALIGYRIARRGLHPISEVSATAQRINAATLDERIDTERLPGELAALGGTINAMLDRLQEAFSRISRFSADIAHELRTPLNNLRGEAEVALTRPRSVDEYRDVLGSCLEEYTRLARLIDSLLFLAKAESPEAQLARERLDLGRELTAVRDLYEAAASEAGVSLTVNAATDVMVDADPALFQRAVGNLVANALAHTPSGGTIGLRAQREGEGVVVEVSDTGRGIAAEHLPYVFGRFYRADGARTTAGGRVGLGLALVKGIMGLHRGTAEIVSQEGQGTRVRLVFPAVGSSIR
jgi:two-component system heavy metal sensor histidine kinase CusS